MLSILKYVGLIEYWICLVGLHSKENNKNDMSTKYRDGISVKNSTDQYSSPK